jgi:hypothetical protein
MEAIRRNTILKKDGEITMTGLPYKKGQQVEMILLVSEQSEPKRQPLTATALKRSGLIGLWKNRTDIKDSSDYARQLREQAQHRK